MAPQQSHQILGVVVRRVALHSSIVVVLLSWPGG
jgi:hypothetical protein